jgi:hypothetical protein
MKKPEPINYTEDYEKLHEEFVKSVVDYHNLYIRFMERSSKGNGRNLAMRNSLKKVRNLAMSMIRESLKIRGRQKEFNKGRYANNKGTGDASRFHKNDMDTPKTDS